MKPVFLIGYMGCGKTTVGVELARALGIDFVDMDDAIESQCQMTIAEIFATLGEKRFRLMEREMVRRLAGMRDVVVSCGGGTPCFGNTIELMNQSGITVWLTTSVERLVARLQLPQQRSKRPSLADLDDAQLLAFVGAECERRQPYYSQAQLHFDATDIETAATTRATALRLAEVLTTAQQAPHAD